MTTILQKTQFSVSKNRNTENSFVYLMLRIYKDVETCELRSENIDLQLVAINL